MERRLSAILAADVVGYSRLMGANEVATLTAMREHRDQLVDPSIAEHHGRIVKLTGDGMLVEFPSVVSAVECAVDIQREMRVRNADVPNDRKLEFRIGINLGDVIVEGDDIFGDGVNVASRIESIATPGGVSISSSVRENVGNKLELQFEDTGDQELKNIEFPVRVYKVAIPEPKKKKGSTADSQEKPSIAVLPFNNMSDDPGQEFFSDGITEDIITDLSKVSGLFVIGRNTSFTYKGKPVQLRDVAQELGVRYILEGSVRKAGDRVRVNGQLIDGESGGHVWADRYDRDLTDIFAIQDEITQSIVEQLKVRLLPKEKKAISQAPTANVEAYTHFLKGREFFHNSTKAFLLLARRMFVKATESDPLYARAYAGIANCDSRLNGWYNVPKSAEEILATASKAIALDPDLADAHAARGMALANSGRDAEATAAFEKALELEPQNYDANLSYARYLAANGQLERAIDLYKRATELQPDDSQAPSLAFVALRKAGREEEAERYGRMSLKRAEEALRVHPESSRPAQLGACVLATLGETDKATEWMEHALAIDPDDNNCRYNAACTFAQMGQLERAMDVLDQWVGQAGSEQLNWFLADGDLDPVRGHARYAGLVDRFKQRSAVPAETG